MVAFPPTESLIGTTLGSYYLEQLIGRNELGPVFLGSAGQGRKYLVRFITAPGSLGPEERAVYQQSFQQVVSEVVELQHRNILPLLDYGHYLGGSYLVTPGMPMQTLISSIARNGLPDLETVGRYLEEIAQGLAYAHERGVVHRNLSTDCIFLLRDGRLVIGDFGVMHLLELARQKGQSYPDYGSGEGRAPEQLLNRDCDARTDIYAFGAVLYRLLTAHAVFRHSSREAVYAQHLHAAVTPLKRWRSDLPAELDEVIARAMKKEPAERFQRPQELVAAYREAIQASGGAAGDTGQGLGTPAPLAAPSGEAGSTEPAERARTTAEGGSFWQSLLERLPYPHRRARRLQDEGAGGEGGDTTHT
jgi:serine/threonine protein kinase